MDVLVPVLMKNAANRDKWNELQNSVNHQMFECKWHFGVTPRSMSVWVSVFTTYNISMFHKALFYSFHVCEKKSGRGLWSVSKRTCLILETHQTSLWVTRKREEKWWEKSIAFIVCVLFFTSLIAPEYCIAWKEWCCIDCVWPVLAERSQEKQNNENEFSFLFFTWCVSVTRQFLCGKENSLHSRCDLSVQFFSNKPFCRGAIIRKQKQKCKPVW